MGEAPRQKGATADAQNATGPRRAYLQPETTIGAQMDERNGKFKDITDDELKALNVQISRALNKVGIKTKGAVLRTASNDWGGVEYDSLTFDVSGEFSLSREYHPHTKSMEHAYFRIEDKKKRGKGTSQAVHRALAPIYEKLGVKNIEVYASLENGGYTWANYGFRVGRSQAYNYASGLKSHSREAYGIVDNYFKRHPKQTRFPMNLLSSQPWAKDVMAGTSWHGTLDLTNPSEKRDFYGYIGYKPKK